MLMWTSFGKETIKKTASSSVRRNDTDKPVMKRSDNRRIGKVLQGSRAGDELSSDAALKGIHEVRTLWNKLDLFRQQSECKALRTRKVRGRSRICTEQNRRTPRTSVRKQS